jgi:hypothetical protein
MIVLVHICNLNRAASLTSNMPSTSHNTNYNFFQMSITGSMHLKREPLWLAFILMKYHSDGMHRTVRRYRRPSSQGASAHGGRETLSSSLLDLRLRVHNVPHYIEGGHLKP